MKKQHLHDGGAAALERDRSQLAAPWVMESPPGAQTLLNGRAFLYFAGTGYLGLQGHPAVLQAAADAVHRFGVHTATSRAGFGGSPPVVEVEDRAAQFLATEASAYLVSGYAGNFALAAAIAPGVELALVDEAAHHSLRESVRWFDELRRPPIAYRHRDPAHVAELLAAHLQAGGRAAVLTDGVFAASGHIAPVVDYLSILDRYPGSFLLIDDAHGLAVLGEQGRGTLEWAGVAARRINSLDEADATSARVFHSATLSKAVGGQGGVLAGSRSFVEQVRAASGWFRGASAPAAPVAAATAKALEIVQGNPELRRQLAANVKTLRDALRSAGFDVDDSPTPIIPLVLDSTESMQAVQQKLLDDGIAVAYARDYAGVGPQGMLRIAVFATHTPPMIARLVDALRRAV